MFDLTKSVAQNKMYLASSSQLFSYKSKISVVREVFVYCLSSALFLCENQLKTEMLNLSDCASHSLGPCQCLMLSFLLSNMSYSFLMI